MKAFLFFLLTATTLAHSEPHEVSTTPESEWKSAPEDFLSARWDAKKLEAVKNQWEAMRDEKMSSALFVVDSGFVVLQLGAVGKPMKVHSVRKSFLNSLFGVLHTSGKLDLDMTLDALEIDDLTPLTAEEKEATIRDLMKCRSGVYLPSEAETKSMREKKPKRGSHLQDTYYYYNNWDFNALGGIYRKLTDSDIFLDFETKIASPIGMEDFDHERDSFYWHKDENNPQSVFPAYHFRLSPRDCARFGLLFLGDGKWKDRQIISEDWIEVSSAAYSNHDSDPEQLGPGRGYGMLWWVNDTGFLYGQDFGGKPFSARGFGGQFIAIVPSENLVIAHANDTSVEGWDTSGKKRNRLVELISLAKK